MDAKKIAQETPENERLSKSEQYIKEAAENQKKAAQQLNKELEKVDTLFEDILKSVPPKDFAKMQNVLTQVNKLLNDAKNGGDINSIVKQLKTIK